MYNSSLLLSLQVISELKKHYEDKLFETKISRNVKLSEAPSFGKPIKYYDSGSKGSEAYDRLAEELLMNKSIVMQWKVSKHVYFRKINHICTDRNILAELDEYSKNNGPFVTNRLRATKDGKHLEIFRKLVRIFEETEKNVPDYDWKSFRYITKNGQVVCAYSYKDYEKLKTVAFARGINDKFDVNLNVETYLDEFGIDA